MSKTCTFAGCTKRASAGSTICKQCNLPDPEDLALEIDNLKKKFSAVKDDNVFLRSQIQRMKSIINKKDKQIQDIISIKVSTISDQTTDVQFQSKLQALRSEMMAISRLSAKNRDMEQELLEKDEELKLLKASMKFTLIKELQIEAQTYFNEARRMKKLLDEGGRSSRRSDWDEAADDRERIFEREERLLEERESHQVLHKVRSKMESLQGEIQHCTEQINSLERISPSRRHTSSEQLFKASGRLPISAVNADKFTEEDYEHEEAGRGRSNGNSFSGRHNAHKSYERDLADFDDQKYGN